MYADRMTDSMKRALDETSRRRAKQVKFNQEHGITPVSIHKAIRDLTDQMTPAAVSEMRGEYKTGKHKDVSSRSELQKVVAELEKQMKEAAKNLRVRARGSNAGRNVRITSPSRSRRVAQAMGENQTSIRRRVIHNHGC